MRPPLFAYVPVVVVVWRRPPLLDMKRLKDQIARRKRALNEEISTRANEFVRGRNVDDKSALRRPEVERGEKRARAAPRRLARMNMLQLEGATGLELDDREVADRVAQTDVLAAVDDQTRRKKFDIELPKMGPYNIDFSQSGADLVLAGLRGHVAAFRWKEFDLQGEVQLADKCSDVKFLVDGSMYAVAQKRFVYMYSKEGVEMHVLPTMANCDRLEYLPNHMLLVAASSQYSVLHYMDVSTGKYVCSKNPAVMRDPTTCLRRNTTNGIVASGDLRGIVKFWSPTVEKPLVQLKAHKGAVRDVQFHPDGRFALTLGVDGKMKIWDTRTLRTLEELTMSYTVQSMDVSATGMVAVAGGTAVHVWKDLFRPERQHAPHMKHSLGYGAVAQCVRFCPYEDVLAIGHATGVSTMLVPGSGLANPDFFRANPYETDLHRKSRVVTGLLDKLPPETISMDLQIAGVDEDRLKAYNEKLQAQRRMRNIKDNKAQRREAKAAAAKPKLPTDADFDELDENLMVQEKGTSKLWKPKKEIAKARKKAHWDKKDSADKVRSKQKMRTSKQARASKMRKAETRIMSGVDLSVIDDGDAAPAADTAKAGKKTAKRPDVGPGVMGNAALRRLAA